MLLAGLPVTAQTVPSIEEVQVLAREVVVEPIEGTLLEVDDRLYAGPLTVTGHSGGLSLVEETTVDNYLLGIREVPFSWSAEALKAQAVAARTYLAWTLERGRSSSGRRFGYDICATAACQVYAGVGGVAGTDGDRWRAAVDSTAFEVLLYRGRPAQALYSSTSSGRTRNVEDVFVGSSPLPYLRGVDSPGESSPFVEWSFLVDADVMAGLMDHAGLLRGDLVGIGTRTTENGEGPWEVVVVGSDGVATLDTWSLRGRLNRAAQDLYPELFPVRRPGSDRRYPTTVLGPTYTISQQYEFVFGASDEPPTLQARYLVRGGGWGHDVGMSQFGAEAMAVDGATYREILAHYYGSLQPEAAEGILPERVRVGLSTDADSITVKSSGPVRVTLDGEVVADGELGSWSFTASEGRILAVPPRGLGLPPRIDGWRIDFDDLGRPLRIRVDSATAAEVRVVVRSDGGRVVDSGFEVRDAGVISIDLRAVGMAGEPALTVTVEARSRQGSAESSLRVLSAAE